MSVNCCHSVSTGGRASSREIDIQGGYLQFDHGCQFIMASDPTVAEQVREWECQRELSLFAHTPVSVIMMA